MFLIKYQKNIMTKTRFTKKTYYKNNNNKIARETVTEHCSRASQGENIISATRMQRTCCDLISLAAVNIPWESSLKDF